MADELHITALSATCFAPSVEQVDIEFDRTFVWRYSRFTLEITDRAGTLVYRAEQDTAPARWTWAGEHNQAGPAVRFVSPLASPYRVRLYGELIPVLSKKTVSSFTAFLGVAHSAGVQSARRVSTLVRWAPAPTPAPPPVREVAVLYDSVELSLGTWLPEQEQIRLDGVMAQWRPAFGGAPPGHADVITWVWGRLGALGWFPGPAPAAPTATSELGKAIRRYRQADPELHTRLFANAGDQCEVAGAAVAAASAIDAALLQKLDAGANDRTATGAAAPIVSEPRVFGGGAGSRVYVDVDRFYIGNVGEFLADAKARIDREWLPRPQLPLRARVYLRSANGGRLEARHASALGDYQIRWSWTDRALATHGLPAYTAAQPSHTRDYVDLALAEIHAAAGVQTPYHNTLTAVGGIVHGNAADARAPFVALPQFPTAVVADHLHSQPDPHDGGGGETTVIFQPSRIAGDNYRVTAELDRSNWPAAVTSAHQGWQGDLSAQSGEFEVWRRVTIAAYVQWGTVTAVTNWAPIQAHFELAGIELVPPVRTWTVSSASAADRQAYDTLANAVDAAFVASKQTSNDPAQTHLRFSPTTFYPEDPRSVEFIALEALGAGQFADPTNIVNEMMIGLLQPQLLRWRTNDQAPDLPALAARYAAAQLWSNSQVPWIAAVGQHFVAAVRRIYDPGAPAPATPVVPASVVAVTNPADRTIAPLAAAALPHPPPTIAAIVDALLLADARPALASWRTQTAVAANDKAALDVLAALVVRMRLDLTLSKQRTHPILAAGLDFAAAVYDGLVGTYGARSGVTLKTHDTEIWLAAAAADMAAAENALRTALGQQPGPPTLSGQANVAESDQRLFKVVGAVDQAQLQRDMQAQVPADSFVCTVAPLRGPGAAGPVFALAAGAEFRMHQTYLELLVLREQALCSKRLGSNDFFNAVFEHIKPALYDAVHGLPNPPAAGLVLYHIDSHPPTAIAVGADTDIASFTESASNGLDGGIVYLSANQPLRPDHLVAHEIGHTLFLQHWQMSEESIIAGFSVAHDHDLADSNCMMSYPAYLQGSLCESHFRLASYSPHFCGKCNLRLRGWDISRLPPGTGPNAHWPAAALPLTAVFPDINANVVCTDVPDLGVLHAQFCQMMADLGVTLPTAASTPTSATEVRSYGGANRVVVAGMTRYRRVPLQVTQRPSNTTLPPTTESLEINADDGSYPDVLGDDVLLTGESSAFKSAWEANIRWHFLKGGSAEFTHHVTLVNVSPAYSYEGTLFHELQHFYQQWDASPLQEGIIELLACMTALEYNAAHNPGAAFAFKWNPSYCFLTQFVIDELLPRMGLGALARMLVGKSSGPLQAILLPKVTSGKFNALCSECRDDNDFGPAAALLLPLGAPAFARPPVRVTHRQPSPQRVAALDRLQRDAVVDFGRFLQTARPPSVSATTTRSQTAELIRLRLKIQVYHEALQEARRTRQFENRAVDNTQRIHRLEKYITETRESIRGFARMYTRYGGALTDFAFNFPP